jgi:cellulose synthase operon protein B
LLDAVAEVCGICCFSIGWSQTLKKEFFVKKRWMIAVLVLFFSAPNAWASEILRATQALSQYMTEDKPLRLVSADTATELSIPLAERVILHDAVLRLHYSHSALLVSERSQLVVRMNGGVVGQVALRAEEPETYVDMRIPAILFKAGYNTLSLHVAQHYTYECEDPTAPELWTEIDSSRSHLSFEYELQSLSPRLSELSELLDPKLFQTLSLTLLTAPTGEISAAQVRWGALVAQSAALRLQYVAAPVHHAFAEARPVPTEDEPVYPSFPGLKQTGLRGGDSFLLGTRDQLTPFIAPHIAAAISDSFLGIYPLDIDPRYFVLVVSGLDAAQVELAAAALSALNMPFADSRESLIKNLEFPLLPPYGARRTVHENHQYTFAELGFRTQTVQGIHNEMKLEFNLPPDLFAKQDTEVELTLHLAYGAGMRENSTLSLYINNEFERAVHLDKPSGEVYRNYKLRFPLRALQAGHNLLSFRVRMVPNSAGACTSVNTSNLELSLFDDSSLRMPPALHFTTLPDLRLFARTGFPYLTYPAGDDLLLYLPKADSILVSSAWRLVAKLAQQHNLPLPKLEIVLDLPDSGRNLIVLAQAQDLPVALWQNAPVKLGETSIFPYPLTIQRDLTDAPPEGFGARLLYHAERLFAPLRKSARPEHVHTEQQVPSGTGLGRYSLLMQYEHPARSKHTATVFIADSSETLAQGLDRLLEPSEWGRLQHDLVLWRGDKKDSLVAQKAAASYKVGDADPLSKLNFYFSRSPWLWLGLMLVTVLLFGLLTVALLARYRRKRHGHVVESAP